jgi:ABC-type multidrug transport system ATPase subunit/ABC-type multidrug transport system permease subunit
MLIFLAVPIIFDARFVAYKQIDSHMYTSGLYLLSYIVSTLPLMIAETSMFAISLYFLSNLSLHVGHFFLFLCIIFLVDLAMAAFFRIIALSCSYLETATILSSPITSMALVFGGYLITEEKIPRWLIWLYWISPFSWALRALARNEANDKQYSNSPAPGYPSLGDIFLRLWEFSTGQWGIWAAIIYIACLGVLLSFIAWAILIRVRFDRTLGTSRTKVDSTEDIQKDADNSVDIEAAGEDGLKADSLALALSATTHEENSVSSPSPTVSPVGTGALARKTAQALPFVPVSLVFEDIKYTVKLTRSRGGGERTLLNGISGFACPNEVLWMMGASGAGKTTLLDVVSGRKTKGKIEGNIYVNGEKQDLKTFAFAKTIGYCEQQDVHMPFATVRESLEFSAKLRLPSSVTASTRKEFVDEILQLTELEFIQNRLVGHPDTGGLSASQRKRLTMAVELCGNTSILCLDEYSTNQDSRAALHCTRVVKAIARSGRTVIATIHQPSEEIFLAADRLLLLQRGGYEAYFGPIGEAGAGIINFLADVEGVKPKPAGLNPGSYMLDVLLQSFGNTKATLSTYTLDVTAANAATTAETKEETAASYVAAEKGTNVPAYYKSSDLRKENLARLDDLKLTKSGTIETFKGSYARAFPVQLYTVFSRTLTSYNRNLGYNLTRCLVLAFLALVFGVLYYHVYPTPGSGKTFDSARVQSIISVVFLSAAFPGVINYGACLAVLERERPVVYREKASRYYRPEAYSFASLAIEFPWLFLTSTVFCVICYFMVGLKGDAATFFHFLIIHWQVSITFCFFAQVCIAAFPTVQLASATAGIILSLWFLMAGLFAPGPQIPAGYKWLYQANPVSYALEAMVIPQFHCAESGQPGANCPTVSIVTERGLVSVEIGKYVAEYFGLRMADIYNDIGIIFIFIAIAALIVIFSHKYFVWIQR